jgi:ribonuclease HI
METMDAVRTPAEWAPTMGIEIASTKEDAVKAEKKDSSTYKVFTDGSGIDGRIGASAVLFEHGVELGALRLYLGNAEDHTVFEGEGIGGVLAMVLLERLEQLSGPVSIYVDSQPAIRATQARTSTPSHWIWDLWHAQARVLAAKHPDARVTVKWAPGHVGIAGNERADVEAKRAAQDRDSSAKRGLPPRIRGALPWSRSATKQHLVAELKDAVRRKWESSKRYERTMQYDTKLLKGSYLDTVDCLPRSLAVLLIQLRTGHVPLAKHLHKIQKADSPICPRCRQADESVAHFLLHCTAHADARRELHRAAGPNARVLSKLLGSPKLLPHLFRFLGRTGRFHSVHGTLPEPPNPSQ